MKNIINISILIFFIIKPVFAKNLFETNFYEVNFFSENVLNDKILKINEIKHKSFNKILKNTLKNNDLNNLKRDLDTDLINIFIKNIIIEKEKIVGNSYYSKIKINFDKKKIINYYRINKIPYTEFHPSNILTIIFENRILSQNLFSIKNEHYNFLLENKKKHNFFLIPNLDLNDRFILDINDIKSFKINNFNKFLKKYSKKSAILIIVNEKDESYYYSIYYYNDKNFELIENFNSNLIKYPKLFADLENKILEYWKNINNVNNHNISTIKCNISYFNIYELRQIKLYLEEVTSIKKITLKTISYRSNTYEINYYGSLDLLKPIFNINGLKIQINKDNCNIYLK